jgi:hypothetical protein
MFYFNLTETKSIFFEQKKGRLERPFRILKHLNG